MFLDSPNRILGTIFEQSSTGLRFGFDPESNVLLCVKIILVYAI